MQKFLTAFALSAALMHAQDRPDPSRDGRRLWLASVSALAAANAIDVHSSLGKYETNSRLTGSAGTFGVQGALIKMSMQAGVLGIQYVVTRRRPSGRLYRALALINFGAAATVGAVAVHNYSVPRAPL